MSDSIRTGLSALSYQRGNPTKLEDERDACLIAFESWDPAFLEISADLIRQAKSINNSLLQVELLAKRSEQFMINRDIESASWALAKANGLLSLTPEHSREVDRVTRELLSTHAHLCWEQGDFDQSIEFSTKALKIANRLDDNLARVEVEMHLGVAKSCVGSQDFVEHYKNALRLFPVETMSSNLTSPRALTARRLYASVLCALAFSSYQSRDLETAYNYLREGLAAGTRDKIILASLYLSLAQVHLDRGATADAVQSAELAYKHIVESRTSGLLRDIATVRAKAVFKSEDYPGTIAACDAALAIPVLPGRSNDAALYSWKSIALSQLARAAVTGSSDLVEQAKECLKLSQLALSHSLQYELPNNLELLSQAQSLIGDGTGAYESLKSSIEKRGETWSLSVSQEISSLQIQLRAEREQHEKELEALRREELERQLSMSAMNLASQTELLASFRNDLHKLVRSSADPATAMKQVLAMIKTLPCEQVDWQKFEAQFVEVHPAFKAVLLQKYPELTKQEVKMCQLARLGLKVSEMAQLLCLSERSVESHRYSLRKKLGLTSEQNLTTFLQGIS